MTGDHVITPFSVLRVLYLPQPRRIDVDGDSKAKRHAYIQCPLWSSNFYHFLGKKSFTNSAGYKLRGVFKNNSQTFMRKSVQAEPIRFESYDESEIVSDLAWSGLFWSSSSHACAVADMPSSFEIRGPWSSAFRTRLENINRTWLQGSSGTSPASSAYRA